ncbi:MAG: glycosyltransferase family 2 protein [Clostridia bacterium]|nr:glycosyltransferase family 2 protein [Clostridia bacterium]
MVSVIVPVYNSKRTLSACIQSIVDQTYRDFELILIDDGSTDGSETLCDSIQTSCLTHGVRCRVIHQKNSGVSSARNCGIKNAAGEYFVCVDSDDVIEHCYLEDLVSTAESHPEIGMVLCGFKCTSHKHSYILSRRNPLTLLSRRDYMRLYSEVLIQGPCLALYKTETVRDCNIKMQESLSLAEDLLFNLDYLDALGNAGIGVINKTNYVYQNNDPNSLFRRYRHDLLEINELSMREIKNHLVKWGVEDEQSWRMYHTAVFTKYTSVLENTFSPLNKATKREKIRFNNRVLQKKTFRDAMEKSNIKLTPLFRLAYKSGNYRLVLLAKRFEKIKIWLRRLIKRGK